MEPLAKKSIFLALGLLALGGAGAILSAIHKPAELSYQGRSLQDWCLRLDASNEQSDQDKAAAAIKEIGSQAIPELIRLLDTQEPAMRKFAFSFSKYFTASSRRTLSKYAGSPTASRVRGTAARALGCLGPVAKPAIPQLIKALHDPDRQVRLDAAGALGWIGPDATSSLILCLNDQDSNVRHVAVFGLGRIGPGAVAAVPALSRMLHDPDEFVRASAAASLSAIDATHSPQMQTGF
jgi:HEAT repeat protein